MSSVQFHGPDAVVKAYENRKVAAWSIWQGRQFMFKYEGADLEAGAVELEETLSALGTSTNAVYTLHVYETFEGRINSKTEDHGSFNFRLNLDSQAPNVGQLGGYGRSNEVLSRLAAIEERLKDGDDEEDEEEGFNLGRVLSGVLQQPEAMQMITGFIHQLFGNMQQPQPRPTALAGVESDPPLQKTLVTLQTKVEDLPMILAKLVRLAEKRPKQFAFYMSALRSMDV